MERVRRRHHFPGGELYQTRASRFPLANPRPLGHQSPSPMDIERDGNLIEAALWFVLGAGLFIYAWLRELRLRPTLRILAVTILFFGGSDLVEARTGAWWKPWWLFVWKAICVLLMTACIVRYYRLTKQRPASSPDKT